MKRARHIFALLGTVVLLMPAACRAGTCALITVTTIPVSFGNYNAALIDSNGSASVACTLQTGNTLPSFTIALSAGDSGNFTTRQMNQVLGSQILTYNIYTTAGYSTVWGDGTGSSVVQSYSAGSNQSTTSFTAYGVLPANQFVGLGLYGDALTVTVTF